VLFLNELEEILELLGTDQLMQVRRWRRRRREEEEEQRGVVSL